MFFSYSSLLHCTKALDGGHDDIEAVRLVRDPETLIGKGIGYLLFKDRDSVLKALSLHEVRYVCSVRTLPIHHYLFSSLIFIVLSVLNARSVVDIQEEEFTSNNMWQDEQTNQADRTRRGRL